MANLAIKGHATRGREVIELLRMLGGSNPFRIVNANEFKYYRIECFDRILSWPINAIIGEDMLENPHLTNVFTLEEFFEKFPYKIGDKVKNARINDYIGSIINVQWDYNENEIIYVVEWNDVTKPTLCYFARDLQPYKEEIIEEREMLLGWVVESKGKRLIPHKDYEIKHDGEEFYLVKKKPQYPKTFVECCEILYPNENFQTVSHPIKGHNGKKLFALQKLLICRNAYWKIAGEEMGLEKLWEPDWNSCKDKFCITIFKNKQTFDESQYISRICAFPTEEMRDTFYENFKELIKQCKELL